MKSRKNIIAAGAILSFLLIGIGLLAWYRTQAFLHIDDQVIEGSVYIQAVKLSQPGFFVLYSVSEGNFIVLSDILEPGVYEDITHPLIDSDVFVAPGTLITGLVIAGEDQSILAGEYGINIPPAQSILARTQFKSR